MCWRAIVVRAPASERYDGSQGAQKYLLLLEITLSLPKRAWGKWLVLLDDLTFQCVVLTIQSYRKLSVLFCFTEQWESAILFVQFSVLCIIKPLVILPYILRLKIYAAGTLSIGHVFCPTKAEGTQSSNEYIMFCYISGKFTWTDLNKWQIVLVSIANYVSCNVQYSWKWLTMHPQSVYACV